MDRARRADRYYTQWQSICDSFTRHTEDETENRLGSSVCKTQAFGAEAVSETDRLILVKAAGLSGGSGRLPRLFVPGFLAPE